jgi:lipopolysaccharide transport system permease protein
VASAPLFEENLTNHNVNSIQGTVWPQRISDFHVPFKSMTKFPASTVTIYTPDSPLRNPGKLFRDMFRDLLDCRELAWRLFVRDLSAQYRQTYLGYLWAFLPPLVTSLTFIYLNSQGIVRIEDVGMPYPAFALIGTLLWQVFVDSIQCPSQVIISSKSILAKVNFPREAILIGGCYMVLFNLVIRLVLLIAVMMIWQIAPGPGLILFPFALLGLIAAGFAVGMAFSPIGALYGDINRGLPIIMQFWMLLTPVVYPPKTAGLAGFLSTWNPLAPLMTTARESLCSQSLTQLAPFLVVTLASVLLVFLGWIAFRLAMPLLIERMGG